MNAFFQIPSSFREKRKEVENEEKYIDGLEKKAKVNVNMEVTGRFAYKSFRQQVVSPTPRSIRLQDQSLLRRVLKLFKGQ